MGKDVVEFSRNGSRPTPPPLEAPKITDVAKMVITLKSDGNVTLQGPVQNSMLCFGMLGEAHKILIKNDTNPIVQT